MILAVVVTAANVQDRDGAQRVLAVLRHQFLRLRRIWADGAEAGPLMDWVRTLRPHRPIRLDMTQRSDRVTGLVVIPQRWIVERTRGWFNRERRLRKDDADHTETSEAMIRVAMSPWMVRRLARIVSY